MTPDRDTADARRMKCCGPSDGWKGETQEFLRLCEAAVAKARKGE